MLFIDVAEAGKDSVIKRNFSHGGVVLSPRCKCLSSNYYNSILFKNLAMLAKKKAKK